MKCDPKDAELQTLLDLDGTKFWPKPQYWVKFEARLARISHEEHQTEWQNKTLLIDYIKI